MSERVPFTPDPDDVAAANREGADDPDAAPSGAVETDVHPQSHESGEAEFEDEESRGGTELDVEESAFREPEGGNPLAPDALERDD